MQSGETKQDSEVLESRFLNSPFLDRLAIILSGTCMIHCLLLPVLITLFPIVQGSLLEEESFHALFLLLVVPTSVIALSVGCKKHRDMRTIALGVSGLGILTFAAFWGHDLIGYDGERFMAAIGGAILATSHILNYRLCRSQDCDHH